MLSALDRKLVRDLTRLWAQVLAVGLVIACGVMTIVLFVGATRSLDETRSAFYERYRFASVFASANRAPERLKRDLAAIEGVAAVETRIVKDLILDIDGMIEPAAGIAVSLPDAGETRVNRLYLRQGRLPEPDRSDEVAVVETFASAHGFRPGDRFRAQINGKSWELTITGVVLSPEFIYAIGPGDMVPDQRRYGILFMPRKTLAAAFDMTGSFNSAVLTTLRNADVEVITETVDDLLRHYGGTGAYGREDQTSHAFLDAELTQLEAMAGVIPPIFLFVSAFLVNMILSRLIALEREQIGLLKASGYTSVGVAWHYAKMVLAIVLVGLVIGSVAGAWLGGSLARLYAQFFSFPFLVFAGSADLYVIAAVVSVIAALAGAASAIRTVVALPPAVAMRPPAPANYRSLGLDLGILHSVFSQLTTMALRHLWRNPVRTGLTALGTSFSVALLVTALFSFDSIDHMIDQIFFQTSREDAVIAFAGDRHPDALRAVRRMPGILAAEPYRQVPVTMSNRHIEERLVLEGLPSMTDLTRVLDRDQLPLALPSNGIVLSDRVAERLDLRVGDLASIEVMQQDDRIVHVPVAGTIQSLVGLTAYMDLEALNRLVRDGDRISGARVKLDADRLGQTYAAVKETPGISSIALTNLSRANFRATIEENIVISITIYTVLAVIITFGVIYNSARIQLSERGRELASLRVFGFTRGEVSSILMIELGVVVLFAQPLGWALGYGFAWSVAQGFESDLYRIPLVVEQSTYTTASLVVTAAAVVSALAVRRRIDRLDLIEVLKTRE